MEIDITGKLRELVLDISDIRGVENVRIVHSVLVEACRYFEKKMAANILDDIMHMLQKDFNGQKHDEHNQREWIVCNIYYKFYFNIFHEIDGPDSLLIMQEELPCGINETLRMHGLTEWERYDIFSRGLKNVDINRNASNSLPLATSSANRRFNRTDVTWSAIHANNSSSSAV